METIKEIFNEIAEYFENITAGDSYVWIIVIAVILLVTLIGFIDDRANKRKAKQALLMIRLLLNKLLSNQPMSHQFHQFKNR